MKGPTRRTVGSYARVLQGKGAKDRTLWLGEEDIALLRHWWERQAKDVAGDRTAIFTTLAGRPVSVRYVQAMVKRYAARAGITKSVHPHTLRHSFATDLYRETKDIRLTQKAPGHANLTTTQIYTHLVDEDLEAALKDLSPNDASGSGVGWRIDRTVHRERVTLPGPRDLSGVRSLRETAEGFSLDPKGPCRALDF